MGNTDFIDYATGRDRDILNFDTIYFTIPGANFRGAKFVGARSGN